MRVIAELSLGESILANAISGLIVAVAVAGIAIFSAKGYTEKRAERQAQRERDRDAAADLYRAYGEFFATWKAWNHHKVQVAKGNHLEDPRRLELLRDAAATEGAFETLLVRITLEHALGPDPRAALWALRSGYKRLRKSIEDDKELVWWKSAWHGPEGSAEYDRYRSYTAFKTLTSLVAEVLLKASGAKAPPIDEQVETLRQVTSGGDEFTTRFSQAIEKERAARLDSRDREKTAWEWVVVAEQLDKPRA